MTHYHCYDVEHGSFLPLIATHSISTGGSGITNAIVVVHGPNEDAAAAYEAARGALGNRTDTLVIAPWFGTEPISGAKWNLRCTRTASIYWPVASMWQIGGDHAIPGKPQARSGVSSFEFLDRLYMDLQSRALFPSLRTVSYVGFSGGGQMVNRYAWATKIRQRNGRDEPTQDNADSSVRFSASNNQLAVRFIVADAPSYLYFSSLRPSPCCVLARDTGVHHSCTDFTFYSMIRPYEYGAGNINNTGTTAEEGLQSAPLRGRDKPRCPAMALTNCREYDDWQYGTQFPLRMKDGGSSYLQPFVDNSMLVMQHTEMYRHKDVRYIFGGANSCNCQDPGYENPPHCMHHYKAVGVNGTVDMTQLPGPCVPSVYGSLISEEERSSAVTCCDTFPSSQNNSLAVSCAADMQGSNRLQRGLNYVSYLKYYFGGADNNGSSPFVPEYAVVPGLQHDPAAFYQSEIVQEWVYAAADGTDIIVPPPVIPQPYSDGASLLQRVVAAMPWIVLASGIVALGVLTHFLCVAVAGLIQRENLEEASRQARVAGAVDEHTHLLA